MFWGRGAVALVQETAYWRRAPPATGVEPVQPITNLPDLRVEPRGRSGNLTNKVNAWCCGFGEDKACDEGNFGGFLVDGGECYGDDLDELLV